MANQNHGQTNTEQKNKPKLIYPLNPRSDLIVKEDELTAYRDWLDRVMSDRSLHNIALLGHRGSGKSSIIHSYDAASGKDNRKREEKYLYISLADFETFCPEDNDPKSDPQEREKLLKRLEYNLLCQILARCTKEDLRRSSLRAIPEVRQSRRFVLFKYLYLFICGLLVFGLMFEDRFGALLRAYNMPAPDRLGLHALGYVAAFTLIFCGAVYLWSRKPGLFRLGKFSFKSPNVDAELTPSQDEYCLDRYRFELVHILNQISDKIDCVVVIEDLEPVSDYYCKEILSKLWELNYLVNTQRRELYRRGKDHSGWLRRLDRKDASRDPSRLRLWLAPWLRWKEPVRFLYALSDDTFTVEERTKFFDTIIPVNPALNVKNAKGLILNSLPGPIKTHTQQTHDLIQMLAETVTDYRTLNDIMTEFKFFRDLYDTNHSPKVVIDGQTRPPQKVTVTKNTVKKDRSTLYISKASRSRSLLALSAYRALFPQEYHYAFTPEGKGILPNPSNSDNPQKYSQHSLDFVDYLFRNKHLDANSLTLVGYSPETLKRQWVRILVTGTDDERLDLLQRFNDTNICRETETVLIHAAVGKAKPEVLRSSNIRVIAELGHHIFNDDINAVLRALYSSSSQRNLPTEIFLNLLLCLANFDPSVLTEAVANFNKNQIDAEAKLEEEQIAQEQETQKDTMAYFRYRIQKHGKALRKDLKRMKAEARTEEQKEKLRITQKKYNQCKPVLDSLLKPQTSPKPDSAPAVGSSAGSDSAPTDGASSEPDSTPTNVAPSVLDTSPSREQDNAPGASRKTKRLLKYFPPQKTEPHKQKTSWPFKFSKQPAASVGPKNGGPSRRKKP